MFVCVIVEIYYLLKQTMFSSIFLSCAASNIVKTTSEDQRTKNNNKSSLEKIETREKQE